MSPVADDSVSFAGHTFSSDQTCLACEHVVAGDPVRVVVHDADGVVQALCGRDGHDPDDARAMELADVATRLPDADALPRLDPGHAAERTDAGWIVEAVDYDEQ